MAALEAGKQAPFFSLPLMSGASFSLADALKQGPVILAFFKISCPVCQFAFPYLERLHGFARAKKVSIIGVSQNTKEDTAAFAREYRITFPIALDDPRRYPVSNSYGLTNVPTIFYVSKEGDIEISSVGWSRVDIEQIARKIGEGSPGANFEVIQPGEEVPAFRAG
jgi:peroxiredoxin